MQKECLSLVLICYMHELQSQSLPVHIRLNIQVHAT